MSKRQAAAFLCFTFALMLSRPATAEIVNCDGVWTNRGCAAAAAEQLPEHEFQPPAKDDTTERKLQALSDLDIKLFDLRRETGIETDSSPAAEVCRKPGSTLQECRDAIAAVQKTVITLLTEKRLAEPETPEVSPTPGAAGQTTVIINNGRWWRHGHFKPKRPSPPLVPPGRPHPPRDPHGPYHRLQGSHGKIGIGSRVDEPDLGPHFAPSQHTGYVGLGAGS